MKTLCFLSFLAAFAFVDSLDYIIYDLSNARELFDKFRQDFSKEYSSGKETERRFKIFVNNLKRINNINSQHLSWVAGINQYADLTPEEFGKCCVGMM